MNQQEIKNAAFEQAEAAWFDTKIETKDAVLSDDYVMLFETGFQAGAAFVMERVKGLEQDYSDVLSDHNDLIEKYVELESRCERLVKALEKIERLDRTDCPCDHIAFEALKQSAEERGE